MKYNSIIHRFTTIIACLLCVSCEAEKNGNNIKMIELGMSKTHVDRLMGNEFDIIDDYFDSTIFQQVYSNTIISSDDYRIYFSKEDSVVVDVGYGE